MALLVALTLAGSASAADCPADLRCSPNVRFKREDGITLRLDVYRERGTRGVPAVVAVHGGGFRIGDKSQMQTESQQLARAGFVVFAPDYRLADCTGARGCDDNGDGVSDWPLSGTAGYDDEYEDVADAVAWVRAHGEGYDADPARVGAFGTSAGAHLALMATMRGAAGAERADAAVVRSGPWVLDLRLFGVAKDVSADPDLMGTEGLSLTGCEWGSSSSCSRRWIEQSVSTYVDDCGDVACDPPARMVQAVDDPVVDEEEHGEIIGELLTQAGIEVELRTYVTGESCSDGSVPASGSGCRSGGDCSAIHVPPASCVDPSTGLTEAAAMADFFDRHLEGSDRRCAGEVATIVGGRRSERIRGTGEPDVIAAGGGSDRVRGRGGADVICGGSGADRLRGNAGADAFRGGSGRDSLRGGPGRDTHA